MGDNTIENTSRRRGYLGAVNERVARSEARRERFIVTRPEISECRLCMLGPYQVPWPSGSLHAWGVLFVLPPTQLTELA